MVQLGYLVENVYKKLTISLALYKLVYAERSAVQQVGTHGLLMWNEFVSAFYDQIHTTVMKYVRTKKQSIFATNHWVLFQGFAVLEIIVVIFLCEE